MAWMFDKRGVITVEKSQIDEDRLMGLVLEAGGEDVKDEGDLFEVVTQPEDFERVKEALDREKIALASAQITMVEKYCNRRRKACRTNSQIDGRA